MQIEEGSNSFTFRFHVSFLSQLHSLPSFVYAHLTLGLPKRLAISILVLQTRCSFLFGEATQEKASGLGLPPPPETVAVCSICDVMMAEDAYRSAFCMTLSLLFADSRRQCAIIAHGATRFARAPKCNKILHASTSPRRARNQGFAHGTSGRAQDRVHYAHSDSFAPEKAHAYKTA